jgi:hypothetical protein
LLSTLSCLGDARLAFVLVPSGGMAESQKCKGRKLFGTRPQAQGGHDVVFKSIGLSQGTALR